ncbi:hypothetical protein [Hydrogenophaga sp. 5NK40-0174]|uniref:hypothetical protein n=1 Tax=Hydrogenophaga sp. 5NK40-0174 TaxID=3127649 RepID=UPI00333EFE0C
MTVKSEVFSEPLNAWTGMRLAYWAYPHEASIKTEEQAKELAAYPAGWRWAKPSVDLPEDFPVAQYDNAEKPTKVVQEGWNTQHNESATLENMFRVSINETSREISFDFKGSDAWSNWKSDLGNSGASEFAQIQAKAQAAFDAISKDPRFEGYTFAATGHSLGGGMAQSFALKNNIDAYVYNSLPIARDTIEGDYFKDVGGFDAALAAYKASDRKVHDVRTPNDIATYWYDGFHQQKYLSELTGQGHDMLPGARMPDFLKTVILLSGEGTLVGGAIMGKDHTMGSIIRTSVGLGIDTEGRYVRPKGHTVFPEVPYEARKRFAELGASRVIEVRKDQNSDPQDPALFHLRREDDSRQRIRVWPNGQTEIDHWSPDGKHIQVELNARDGSPATFRELDRQGQTLSTWEVAMREAGPSQGDTRLASDALTPEQMQVFVNASEQVADPLIARGLKGPEVAQVCAATVAECTRRSCMAQADRFLVSHDGEQVGVMNPGGQMLAEVQVGDALTQPAQAHFQDAVQAADSLAQGRGTGEEAPVQALAA